MDIIEHTTGCFNAIRQYEMLWPRKRKVTADELISWAKDDIANNLSKIFDDPRNVQTVEDAIAVLNDSGTVTLAKAGVTSEQLLGAEMLRLNRTDERGV